jgi:hypothetical protein
MDVQYAKRTINTAGADSQPTRLRCTLIVAPSGRLIRFPAAKQPYVEEWSTKVPASAARWRSLGGT